MRDWTLFDWIYFFLWLFLISMVFLFIWGIGAPKQIRETSSLIWTVGNTSAAIFLLCKGLPLRLNIDTAGTASVNVISSTLAIDYIFDLGIFKAALTIPFYFGTTVSSLVLTKRRRKAIPQGGYVGSNLKMSETNIREYFSATLDVEMWTNIAKMAGLNPSTKAKEKEGFGMGGSFSMEFYVELMEELGISTIGKFDALLKSEIEYAPSHIKTVFDNASGFLGERIRLNRLGMIFVVVAIAMKKELEAQSLKHDWNLTDENPKRRALRKALATI